VTFCRLTRALDLTDTMKAIILTLLVNALPLLVTTLPADRESDSMMIADDTTSFPLPVSTAVVERREMITQPGQGIERSQKMLTSACRLLAKDPYLHRKLDKLAAGGSTDLVEYELSIPDGYQPPVGKHY
jgi:hypothetical protein